MFKNSKIAKISKISNIPKITHWKLYSFGSYMNIMDKISLELQTWCENVPRKCTPHQNSWKCCKQGPVPALPFLLILWLNMVKFTMNFISNEGFFQKDGVFRNPAKLAWKMPKLVTILAYSWEFSVSYIVLNLARLK